MLLLASFALGPWPRLQGALASKEKLAASQQQTIQQLEGTIREQQADIRAALALVSSRPTAGTAGEVEGLLGAEEEEALGYDSPAGGSLCGVPCAAGADWYSSSPAGWEATLAAAGDAAGAAACSGVAWDDTGILGGSGSAWDGVAAGELGSGAGGAELESLLGAAAAAADAATAWAAGYGGGDAAGSDAGWMEGLGYDGMGEEGWTIPTAPASPPSQAQAAPGHLHMQQRPRQQQEQQRRNKGRGSSQPSSAAAVSLQGSPGSSLVAPGVGAGGLAAVEADIEGLERALRSALTDLSI